MVLSYRIKTPVKLVNMKFLQSYLLLFPLAAILFMTACNDDDPVIPNDEELITTLTYTLSPTGGGADVVLRFSDLDGDGGNPPVITGGTLANNTSYTGALILLNESESPADDITAEIKAEDEDHQFFFAVTGTNLTIEYADQDANGNPIGLSTDVSTGDAAVGTLTITLRHEPDKSANGVADGNIDNAGGETDIEVTFPVEVQ